MPVNFMDNTWPELKEYIKKNALVILPVAQVEEHGPHLPVGCDTFIGSKIAKLVSEELNKTIPTLLMPAVWAGYSPIKMMKWPGTIRVKTKTVCEYVHDIIASLCEMGFKKIVIIDSHGQHRGILEVSIREIADEYNVYCALTNPVILCSEKYSKIRKTRPGGSTHAGELETSLLMAMGYKISLSKATDEDKLNFSTDYFTADAIGNKKYFISTWGLQESKSGIYGAPLKSDPKTGKILLEEIVKNHVNICREYWNIKTC
ncbi:MAG: creatininase family protein [Actinobacteria bacterium]|nr:creatininase family protein [Actinomycetota bacterium]